MSIRSRLVSWWRQLVHGGKTAAELHDELHAWVDLVTDERVRAGQSPDQARRAALLEVGGVEQVKEAVRDARGLAFIDVLWQDVRYGLRQFTRAPGFFTAAVVALALGIGATAATFSVVDAVLLRPLGYHEPDALTVIRQDSSTATSPLNFFAWRRLSRSFEDIEAAEYWAPNLSGGAGPEKSYGLRVTPGMFRLLGVAPEFGRTLREDDESAREVVISRGIWIRRFGGDPSVIGRAVLIDSEPYTVVGVMPRAFQFAPFWATRAEIWAPLPLADRATSGGQSLRVFARLAPGATLAAASDEMATIGAELERQTPGTTGDVVVTPLADLVVGDVRQAILVIFAAVGLVLLVACTNVAHMLLARATARRKEVAVRAALGAGRRRLIRQFLTEVLLLCGAGGAAGIVLAAGTVSAITRLAGTSVPRMDAVSLDLRVLAFVVVVSVLSGVMFGLTSVLRLSQPDPSLTLRDEDRGSSSGQQTRRARGVLTVSEVALTCVLLVGAGLMLRSFVSLRAANPGWDADQVVSMVVSVAGTAESPAGRRTAFYQSVVAAVEALPGVERASAINHLPLAGDIWTLPFEVDGAPTPAPGEGPSAAYRVVLPGYFEAFGLPLMQGRDFTEQDTLDVPSVVIVNEFLAATIWPGQDPIGRRIDMAGSGWLTVVGVTPNTFLYDWASPPSAEAYLPYLQSQRHRENPAPHTAYMTLVVRATDDPARLVPAVRSVIRSLAPDVTVSDVIEMRQVTVEATSGARFLFALVGGFAGVALLLAAVGIYGVISYDVASRLREIGIRLALGATPRQVLLQVVGRGMSLVAVGTGVGLVAAFALSGLLASTLHGVPPTDPLVFGVVPVTLSVAAALACFLPAWRASRVQPLEQLR